MTVYITHVNKIRFLDDILYEGKSFAMQAADLFLMPTRIAYKE